MSTILVAIGAGIAVLTAIYGFVIALLIILFLG